MELVNSKEVGIEVSNVVQESGISIRWKYETLFTRYQMIKEHSDSVSPKSEDNANWYEVNVSYIIWIQKYQNWYAIDIKNFLDRGCPGRKIKRKEHAGLN